MPRFTSYIKFIATLLYPRVAQTQIEEIQVKRLLRHLIELMVFMRRKETEGMVDRFSLYICCVFYAKSLCLIYMCKCLSIARIPSTHDTVNRHAFAWLAPSPLSA